MMGCNRSHLVDFHARILANDTCPAARSIKEHPIKSAHHLGKLSTVIRAYGDVFASHTMDVGRKTLRASFGSIVGEDVASILEESGNVCRFATWSRRHVEYAFVGLWAERNNRQEGRSSLEHVVSSQIFGRRTFQID